MSKNICRFDGMVALVTGSAGGIGGAIAARLATDGARVIGLDRRAGDSPEIEHRVVDLAMPNAIPDALASDFQCDVFIHAAGASSFGGVLEAASEDWHRIYAVNVVAFAEALRSLVPNMPDGSCALAISSINARYATPTLAAYARECCDDCRA
jgi:NADP-dependent 3-hydroxy acid dehydrogenase YdfG